MSFSQEPALYLSGAGAIVEALLVLLVAFGVPIDNDQKAAVSALVTVVVTFTTGILIRSQVTPTAHIAAPVTPIVPPAG
jgi:hypothetical protein